jgi:hypothetical protein
MFSARREGKEIRMSTQSVARRFVELCIQGKNFDVMRTMYAATIVSVEGDGQQTAGQQPVIHKSEIWQGENEIHDERVRGPFFGGPNQFAVHFTFDVTRKATGKRETIEEVGLYTPSAPTTRSRASNSSTTARTDRGCRARTGGPARVDPSAAAACRSSGRDFVSPVTRPNGLCHRKSHSPSGR